MEDLHQKVDAKLKLYAKKIFDKVEDDKNSTKVNYVFNSNINGNEVICSVALLETRDWLKEPFTDTKELKIPLLEFMVFLTN